MPRAAVMFAPGAPLEIHEVTLEGPREHEVRLRLSAAGVCHSDLSTFEDNGANFPMPLVLGHEGAGVVMEIGEGVTHVRPGDHVIMMPMPQCGRCYYCSNGLATLCEMQAVLPSGGLFDRTTRLRIGHDELHQLSCAGTFVEEAVIPASGAVRIDPEMPLMQAAVIGCAVATGFGAARNVADLRPGDSVAVVGCGGVGLNVIQGARSAGAEQIIAIDVATWKLDLAREFGATDTIDASAVDPVAAVHELTGGGGVAVGFEAVGNSETIRQLIDLTRRGGQCIFTGMGSDSMLSLPAAALIATGKTLKGNLLGMADFHRAFPELVSRYINGELLLDPLISKVIDLSEVNEAFNALHAGAVARTVIGYA